MQSQTPLRQLKPIVAELSDEALVASIARRDRQAFAKIYDRYARVIFVFAAHFLHTRDAEEVVQEVFLRLWNRASQFDAHRGLFRYWFMAIARNYLMDELRRHSLKSRMMVVEEINDLLANAQDPNADIDDQVWENNRASLVLETLRALPDEQRRVLLQSYFGGLTQSEIAKEDKIPLGTVKKRIRLGLRKIHALLQEKALLLDE